MKNHLFGVLYSISTSQLDLTGFGRFPTLYTFLYGNLLNFLFVVDSIRKCTGLGVPDWVDLILTRWKSSLSKLATNISNKILSHKNQKRTQQKQRKQQNQKFLNNNTNNIQHEIFNYFYPCNIGVTVGWYHPGKFLPRKSTPAGFFMCQCATSSYEQRKL